MKIEIRSAREAIIEGYVNAVERDSRILPRRMCGLPGDKSFVERVRARTFERALGNTSGVELRFNHEDIIGGTGENLELFEDNIGLHARAVVTDERVIHAARHGELRGWSFGFVCRADEWEDINETLERRTLTDIDLIEVSVLNKAPAYIGTSVELRGGVVTEMRGGIEAEPTIIRSDPFAEDGKRVVQILRLKGEIYS